MMNRTFWTTLICVLACSGFAVLGQDEPPSPTGGRGGRGVSSGIDANGNARFGGGLYPVQSAPSPQVFSRGKALWDESCASCHASDLRGTPPRGINLVRDQLVMDDKKGELIGQFLQQAHAAGSVPKTTWTDAQISDVAAYMHTFFMYLNTTLPAGSVLVGDAVAGQAYVRAHCLNCHSLTGKGPSASSLAGVGSRISDPKTLQNRFVSGGNGRGAGRALTVTITNPDGKTVTAPMVHKDDFEVVITDPDGMTRSIPRNGDVPKVVVNDPLQGHRDLWLVYTDKDIHDVTAYLVTLK